MVGSVAGCTVAASHGDVRYFFAGCLAMMVSLMPSYVVCGKMPLLTSCVLFAYGRPPAIF